MTSNKITILDNKSCQFETEDMSLLNSLRSFLSFKPIGIEFTPAYKRGWDGVTYLLNKKGIFPSGLLPKVRSFLSGQNISFEEEDKRTPVKQGVEIDLLPKLAALKMSPYDHQNRIVEAALQNRKGIVRAATGSGKSAAIALLTAKLNKPTLILVIGLDLLQQFYDLFSELFDEPIGFIGNGECRIERINIATIQTIGSALRLDKKSLLADDEDNEEERFNDEQTESIISMLKAGKVFIVDESHIVTTNTLDNILKQIDPEYIYGFSGTPFRGDNTDLLIHGILGEKIIDVSASELIEKKLLAQPIIRFIPVPKIKMNANATYLQVYKEAIVENSDRNNLIVKGTKQLIEKGYSPLILFKQIKHGKLLQELMEDNDIKSVLLYGNDPLSRRLEVKEQLINGEIQAIVASTILDIGFNLPQLNALILAGSGKSYTRCLQRIGRCIRAFEGKTIAAVIDFYDQVKYLKKHSQIRYEVYCSEKGFKVIPCKEML